MKALTSLDVRSLIIRNLQRCNHYPNTDNLQRLEKEAQIKEIDTPKTDRLLSVSDRALFAISRIDMSVLYQVSSKDTGMPGYYNATSDDIVDQHSHTLTCILQVDTHFSKMYNHDNCVVMVMSTHPIIEMEEHFLVYYSYERNEHILSLMHNSGIQCTNVCISVQIWTSMHRNEHQGTYLDILEKERRGVASEFGIFRDIR